MGVDTIAPTVRLQHVALTFPPGDQDRVRAFYGDALGIPEMPVPDAVSPELGWVWFATEDASVELHFIPSAHAPDPAHIHHMCLEVPEIAPIAATLAGLGHAVTTAGTAIPGRERVFVRDPFDNLIELVAITG